MTDQFFMISASNQQLQQQLEYTLLKPDCYSWWISKIQSGHEDTLEEWYTKKFSFKLGKNATETYGMLQTAFRPSCMNRASVFEWHKRFKEGRESLRDDERYGRSKEVSTPELIGQRFRVRVTMLRFLGSSGRDSLGRGQHSSNWVSGISTRTMHQSTTLSLSQTIWPRWPSRQFLSLPIVQTLFLVTFGYSLSSEAIIMRQLRRWKRLQWRSLTCSLKSTSMGPSRSCWNGTTSALQPEEITSKETRVSSNQQERIKLWKQHFENLLGNPPKITPEPITRIISKQLDIKLGPFTQEELDSVLRKIKNRKAAGLDEIPPEVWKTRQFDDILLRHCNAVYNQNPIDRWTKGCILPFPKKGSSD